MFVANDSGQPPVSRPAALDDERMRSHLPEGSNGTSDFLTVREMLGPIEYTTNSAQRDGRCRTC